MDREPMLTVTEAAERLRVNPETVRVWLRSGKMHGYRPGGDRMGYRIPESEVERVLRGEPDAKTAAVLSLQADTAA